MRWRCLFMYIKGKCVQDYYCNPNNRNTITVSINVIMDTTIGVMNDAERRC